jgi:hypothetical protein
MIDRPAEMQTWRDSVENQITQAEGREYQPPPGLSVNPNVRPLRGAQAMQKWFMIATVIGLLLIPLIIVLVMRT